MAIFIGIIIAIIVIWFAGAYFMRGRDHSQYDTPEHSSTGARASPSDEHHAAVEVMAQGATQMPKAGRKDLLALMRRQMDEMGEAAPINAEIVPVDAGGVPSEWVIAPDARPERRLLYLHGGAYQMGSPRSHRAITSTLSEISDCSVLAIDYRLMPEHPRKAGIDDCRTAYRWILEHGPEGPAPLQSLVVAGDSAGGNLTLSTIAWARDEGLRAADAAVAISPQTDATMSSPSLRANIETDTMLGPMFGPVAKAPRSASLWFSLLSHRISPSNPMLSPLHGDLSDLPPTLLHASEAEMLLDDAIRYANKALDHGSHAQVQTWPFMLHVWHAFAIPEAKEAFEHIEAFLREHTYGDARPAAAGGHAV